MPKFELGQAVRVVHGSAEPFAGRITKIEPLPLQFYRVEATGKDGRTYAMTVEEDWLEPDGELKVAIDFTAQATCLIASLKSAVFYENYELIVFDKLIDFFPLVAENLA